MSLPDLAQPCAQDIDDLQQDFLRLIAENLPALHDSFLNAMDPSPDSRADSERWAGLPAGEPYLWHHLVYHLLEAGRREELRALLTGARWLIAKLSATEINALISDYRSFPQSDPLKRIGEALVLSAHVVHADPSQIASQLTGRLASDSSGEMRNLLKSFIAAQRRPWLRPLTQSLVSPGGPLLKTLAGHTAGVYALAVSADGRRVISGSYDHTLKLWDINSGKLVATFFGEGAITSVQFAPQIKTIVAGDASGAVHFLRLENAD